ncbi:phosphoribosyltransferase [Brevundimonas phage vB_BpoS-StAshley]|nr:phosphoribosyltransferase [Brevundimonas phage vB_BpoS-StAshley]
MPKKIYLDWNDVTGAVSTLAKTIEEHNCSFSRILAVARGGLVPAAMLSHQLGIKIVGSLQLRSYSDTYSQESVVPWSWQQLTVAQGELRGPRTLILDDLHDTGKTLEFMKRHFPEATIATLYHKQHTTTPPPIGFPGLSMPADKWIVFPWESDDVRG